MNDPIYIENENLLIHSFGPEQITNTNSLAADVYNILSDDHTLRFLPGKRLHSIDEAAKLLKGNLLNFHARKNYLHFISDKSSGVVIGMIDIISPEVAREHYHFNQYPYFIEFCLKSDVRHSKIMSRLLPQFVGRLRQQDITDLGAVIDRGNSAARKVLEKAGFVYLTEFDLLQDFYTTTLN